MNALLKAWIILAIAVGGNEAQSNTCTAQPQSVGAHCIQEQGKPYAAAYCSSFLSISTSTIPSTTTLTETKSINRTELFTQTKTDINATVTSYVDTTTVTLISPSTVYTCGVSNSSKTRTHASGSITIPRSTGRNLTVALTPSTRTNAPASLTPFAAPSSYAVKERRESMIFFSPRCLRKFAKAHGDPGVSSACECLGIQTPPPVTRTVTVSYYDTITALDSKTSIATESTIKTINATSTYTVTSISTVITSSPTPSTFNIFYVDSSSSNTDPPANFFKAITAPGDSGIVLASEAAADSFSLDSMQRLVDTTDGSEFITKNTYDLYPFQLLRSNATSKNTPVCSACNGTLECDYPGTSGNTFALCYGYLALGPKSIFGKDTNADGHVDCVPIKLQFN